MSKSPKEVSEQRVSQAEKGRRKGPEARVDVSREARSYWAAERAESE